MNFKNTLMAAAVAAGLAISGNQVLSQQTEASGTVQTQKAEPTKSLEKVCDSIRVEVTSDTTGNIIMGYLANEQGINLGKKTTVATNDFTIIDRGYSKGKTLHVVSRMKVQHAQHTYWTWDAKKAEDMVAASNGKSVSISVEMTPRAHDYIFGPLKVSKDKTLEGDALVVDVNSMAAAKEHFSDLGKKLQTAYASQDCKVTFNPAEIKKLDAYMDTAFGAEAEAVRDALKKTGADPNLVEAYGQMSTREVMVRRVTPDAQMYKPLKEKGVVVEDIVEVAKKEEKADEDRYVIQRRGPSEPRDYLCVGWLNPTKVTKTQTGYFSANCRVPVAEGSWSLEIVGTQEALKAAVGEDFYKVIEAKARDRREFAPRHNGARMEDNIYAMNRSPSMELIRKLSPLVEATDRSGIVSPGFDLYDHLNDPNKNLKKAGIQRVNAAKQ